MVCVQSSETLVLHIKATTATEIPQRDSKHDWSAWAAYVFFYKFLILVEIVESEDNMKEVKI